MVVPVGSWEDTAQTSRTPAKIPSTFSTFTRAAQVIFTAAITSDRLNPCNIHSFKQHLGHPLLEAKCVQGGRDMELERTMQPWSVGTSRIKWSAIFSGWVVGLATQMMLTLLGLAIGAWSIDLRNPKR